MACYRYFAGLADKIHGTTIELDDQEKYATTRKEPIGVVAQVGKRVQLYMHSKLSNSADSHQ